MSGQRKIILDLAVSLDGYIEGKKGEIDWCIMEPEMDFPAFLKMIDTIFYGRKSYDLWGQFEPSENATTEDQEMWDIIKEKKKYVFSKTRKGNDGETIFINNRIAQRVQEIKNEQGKDIWLYGGAQLIKTFMKLDLVDEFRLSIHPVILGGVLPLFVDIQNRSSSANISK